MAVIGVGNCASAFVQGVQYYRDADPAESVPGLMHVDLGGYHVRDIEFTAAFDIDADKVGKDLSDGDLLRPEQHDRLRRRVPPIGRGGHARHDPRRPRALPVGEDHEGPRLDRGHRPGAQGHPDRRGRLLPPRRLRAGHEVVRGADHRGTLRLRELHPGLHRQRGLLEQPLPQGRAADRRRRHQVAGRGHDRAPRARPPLPRPRRQAAAHLPAQRGRATWTSTTCSSASGWSPRRSPRRRP